MTQAERRKFLIDYLLSERSETAELPKDEYNQKRLLRSLFNIRMPKEISGEFIKIQDEYLREETSRKGITDIADLVPVQKGIYLWQGDITTLKCDAVVNAANSQMLGCFCLCHGCIDNAIHTYSGVQLRNACYEIMKKQGHEERTGQAKITPAFNLPCKFVIHTVGPIVGGRLTEQIRTQIESAGLRAADYAAEETFALRNAVPTAEGAIQIAMQELPVVLHGLPCLILGAGRVSRALQTRLRALGTAVTVAARRCTDLARTAGAKRKPFDIKNRSIQAAVPELSG